MNIEELLNSYIDNNYKEFHKKICQTKYEILGIKIPILRKIAKSLLKNNNYQEILDNLNNKYYEHIMLRGLIISNIKTDYNNKLSLIDEFLPYIDNWAICDIFCGDLKFINNYKDEFLKYLHSLDKFREYYYRFYLVILLDYYINDKYLDFVLNEILKVNSDYYYVKMAASWCLSICLIKYFDKTILFMNSNKYDFDKWIFNKSLQKAMESFRITKENKEILKNMKL